MQCDKCGGTGKVTSAHYNDAEVTCPVCGGTGDPMNLHHRQDGGGTWPTRKFPQNPYGEPHALIYKAEYFGHYHVWCANACLIDITVREGRAKHKSSKSINPYDQSYVPGVTDAVTIVGKPVFGGEWLMEGYDRHMCAMIRGTSINKQCGYKGYFRCIREGDYISMWAVRDVLTEPVK